MIPKGTSPAEPNPKRKEIRRQLQKNLSRDLSPEMEPFRELFQKVSGDPAIAEEAEAMGLTPEDNTYRYYLLSRFLDRLETLQEQIAPPGVRCRLVLSSIPPTCVSLEFWHNDPRCLVFRAPNPAEITRKLGKIYADRWNLPAPLSEKATLFIAVNRVYRNYNPDEEPCLLDELNGTGRSNPNADFHVRKGEGE